MALASVSQRVGGGAKIAEKWRESAGFDPISEGTQPRAAGRGGRAITTGRGPPVQLPVATANWPDPAIAGRLPVAGDNGQLTTGGGPVCLKQWTRGAGRHDSLT